MFAKETYIARRAKLKQTIGSGLLLFLGNDESGMNYADNTYHFRLPACGGNELSYLCYVIIKIQEL